MRILRLERSQKLIDEFARRGSIDTARVERKVQRIVSDVRRGGDKTLRRYATQLDRLGPRQPVLVSRQELDAAWKDTDRDFRKVLEQAAANIRRFCEWQLPKSWSKQAGKGIRLGQVVRPLDSAGCYVPGGRYPLPSTVLMTVVPAQVAGVPRIVVVSPKPAKETLAAARMLGITEFYRIGGAQAVAALAYGTETIDPVAKIVGPGNIFVTTAKKLVAFDCGIDMLAGPTEAVVVSAKGNPSYIAADLVAQAEHDPQTLVIFLTPSIKLAEGVRREAQAMAAENPIAREALKSRAYILVSRNLDEAMNAANRIASEHVTVDEGLAGQVTNAGSLFVGDYAAQSLGDYAAGPNHVLPTGALARIRGGLSVYDFVKIITVQEVSQTGLRSMAPLVTRFAEAEGLQAHANSVRVRCARA